MARFKFQCGGVVCFVDEHAVFTPRDAAPPERATHVSVRATFGAGGAGESLGAGARPLGSCVAPGATAAGWLLRTDGPFAQEPTWFQGTVTALPGPETRVLRIAFYGAEIGDDAVLPRLTRAGWRVVGLVWAPRAPDDSAVLKGAALVTVERDAAPAPEGA